MGFKIFSNQNHSRILELFCSGNAGNAPLEKGKLQGMLRAPAGTPGELERDWGQGLEGHREWGKGRLGKEFLAGLELPEQLWLPLDPWHVQGQAGWGLEQPGTVEGVPIELDEF